MSLPVFYAISAATLLAAASVLIARNAVHSALGLVAALVLIAVFYAALDAHLVAALQIIVYAGAVMVLFLFVIMLLNIDERSPAVFRLWPALAALGAAVTLAGTSAAVLWKFPPSAAAVAVTDGFGSTKALGRVIFTDHLVAFELTSIFLLAAVVGAVVMVGRRDSSASAALSGDD